MHPLAEALLQYLQAQHREHPAVTRLVKRVNELELSADFEPSPPRHQTALDQAVDGLRASSAPGLAQVGAALNDALGSLSWRTDDGLYYLPDAPVSASYRGGNMHALLGQGDDFSMGLFLLLPHVEYLDHRHSAPEFYLNLTGPTRWRFDHGDWQEQLAGSVLWNEPNQVHATKTGDEPWLSFWAWVSDIEQPCEIVRFEQPA